MPGLRRAHMRRNGCVRFRVGCAVFPAPGCYQGVAGGDTTAEKAGRCQQQGRTLPRLWITVCSARVSLERLALLASLFAGPLQECGRCIRSDASTLKYPCTCVCASELPAKGTR